MKIEIGNLKYDCKSYIDQFTIVNSGITHVFIVELTNIVMNNHDEIISFLKEIENQLKQSSYNIKIINGNEEKTIFINNFNQCFYDNDTNELWFSMTF